LPGKRQQLQELGVVVQHLLEMRDEPSFVDRIARESAAEVVVDAALADVGQRGLDGVPGAVVAEANGAAP
jgi:hypothetical protein